MAIIAENKVGCFLWPMVYNCSNNTTLQHSAHFNSVLYVRTVVMLMVHADALGRWTVQVENAIQR